VPSARFRLRQYIPTLRQQGIETREFVSRAGTYPPRGLARRVLWGSQALLERLPSVIRARRDQVAFMQREMISTLVTLEPLLQRPRIFDVDDAIWVHRGGRAARRLAQMSDLVICGNDYLADKFSSWNQNVRIIPTGVDTRRYRPLGRQTRPDCVIGWIGTVPGFGYLRAIEGALASVLRQHQHVVLRIVSNEFPVLAAVPTSQVQLRRWSADTEISEIQDFDIGIMPLLDNEFARGKCSFKMLQYMACGVPVVASPFGMNGELLAQAEIGISADSETGWITALNDLVKSTALRSRLGNTGRELVTNYDTELVASSLASAIRSVL
jgi:glycosyltransferase involved in cell wall biosynthesis